MEKNIREGIAHLLSSMLFEQLYLAKLNVIPVVISVCLCELDEYTHPLYRLILSYTIYVSNHCIVLLCFHAIIILQVVVYFQIAE